MARSVLALPISIEQLAAERMHLWTAWTEVDLDHLEEKDVRPDAAPAR
jgi:hypothetical protein